MKTIVVIGNGSMAVDCLKIIRMHGQARVPLVVADPQDVSLLFLKQYCGLEGIPLQLSGAVNSADTVGRIRALAPDLIFNINSFQIIKEELIAVPREGIINFHNGPLPKYRGINVCSWAIMNGEKRYGVSWHLVERGVDAGDIIAQRFFPVSETETAFSLIAKCIKEGVLLFGEFFPALCRGELPRTRQDHALASRYTRKDIPNDGYVDYGWNFEKFDRFVRGLNFTPIQNRFVHPTSIVNSMTFYIQKVARYQGAVPSQLEPGTILGVGEGGVDVKIKDDALRITQVLNDSAKPVRLDRFIENYQLQVGGRMEPSGCDAAWSGLSR
ncbi:methionyl-tRNA formyltransferase [Geomonas sp.]|uniref:methionyl-tRNA formyltransferase n=1 Tax=Geomonas sp. TaxID=2651584 RepID=UPI002B4624BA|nr:formyltransferase family protein [Geomonas sp.]HJV35313.1 formyltransferase family protein [Geomonas sp.]